ncbi:MAG: DedA family protein [Proteobacteria bacterium]|nr:DedA family protein [Pseudomonadota bacterium]MBS0574330.1 DedA family protein [Pseudomonadota bacterium]
MTLEHLLETWGLPALFCGSIVEGDGVALLGGVLAHRGIFPFEAAALVLAAGAFAVDQSMYFLGRHGARLGFVRRLVARPATRGLLDRIGRRPVAFCLVFRFLYGLKTLGALAIGAAGVPALTFLALDVVVCLAWAHLLAAIGFGAGHAIEATFGRLPLHRHLTVALGALLLFGGMFLMIRRRCRG